MTIQNSEKTVYLHVGHGKTGTTTIQNFLFRNKKILEQYDVCYPVLDRYEDLAEPTSGNAPNLRPLHKAGNCDKNQCVRDLNILLKKGAESSCQKILLSEEFLNGNNEFSRTVFEAIDRCHYTVKIIAYVRPMASYIGSFYYQHVKKDRSNLVDLPTLLERGVTPCSSILNLGQD